MKSKTLESILQRIGCGLTSLREQKGYNSIKDFATAHDLPMIQYWRIEKGKANITVKTLIRLLAIHQITLDDFFSLVRDHC